MKISKIILYDEPSVPEIKIKKLASFVKNTFKINVETRKNIFFNARRIDYERFSACRIINTNKPFESHIPSIEDIEFEKECCKNTVNLKSIVLYDGFEFQRAILDLVPEHERTANIFHLVFTNRLTCTYDTNDYRYHGRAVICSNPAIISTTGIIEAPAKPRQYYMELISNMTQGLNLESMKKKYQGTYLEYHDNRIASVIEGYTMQALFYYLWGEAFCNKQGCRLFNAHWQKDLIFSQIENGKLCEKHQNYLEITV